MDLFKTEGFLNNLEDLLQRIRSKMERKALTLLSAVYKVPNGWHLR
jgi:hypothetical protein